MTTPVRSEPRKPFRSRFRLWEKKRGDRRTGSKWMGRAGEMLFWAAMFLVGVMALSELIVSRWVNGEATEPGASWGVWLLVLIFVTLIGSGLGGMIFTLLQVGTSAERRSAMARRATMLDPVLESRDRIERFPAIPSDENLTNSPGVRLRYRLPVGPTSAPHLVVVAITSLVWNSVVAVLVVLVANQKPPGTWQGWSLLVVFAFAVIGILAMYYLFRLLVFASAVGPTSVEISDHPLLPGKRYRIYVAQLSQQPVSKLQLSIVCDEKVSYRQGTDTRTETRRVYENEVFVHDETTLRPSFPFEFEGDLKIPEHAMHSFQTDHNSIDWKLLVRGETRHWPAYERAFPIIIYPSAPVPPT